MVSSTFYCAMSKKDLATKINSAKTLKVRKFSVISMLNIWNLYARKDKLSIIPTDILVSCVEFINKYESKTAYIAYHHNNKYQVR